MSSYDEVSEIIVAVELDTNGNPIKYVFEWKGESPFVVISKKMLNETNIFRLDAITLGGFNLLRIRDDGDRILYVREDVVGRM